MLLKQSTSVVLSFGPFLDKTDGVTLEVGLVAAIDHATTGILLSKNGGAQAIRSQAVTASTYDAHGCYRVTLSATDTNTLGSLLVIYTDAATCLPVWQYFNVVAANVYDSLIGGGDILDVSVTQWLGTAVGAGTAGVPNVDITRIANAVVSATTAQIGANVVNVAGAAVNALVSGRMDSSVGAMAANVITAAATAADAGAELADAVWDEARSGHVAAGSFGEGVASVQGNVTGSAASVTGAVGSVTGAVGSVTGAVGSVTGAVGSVTADVPLDEAAIADAVWDEPLAQARGAGSYGETYQWLIAATKGTADAGGSSTTIIDAERTEADTDYWKSSVVLMTSGPNIGLLRRVTAFNATTDTITLAPAFPQAVAVGNTYMLIRTAFNEVLVDAIKAGAVDAAAVATDAIDADAIAANAIDAASIATGAITAAKFAAGAIDAAAIGTGAIDADAIAADAITAAKVAAGTIDAATFAAGAIDAASIATGAITAAKFAAGAIDAAAIANAAIDAATFAAGAVDAAALAADAGTEIAAAVWDRAESAITTASSIGVKLKNTLPQKITKNTALSAFMFLMVDSTDHVTGKTGLTITAERSLDGAAFGACANLASEVANGMYKINLAATDLNADVVTLKFTGTAADARFITIVTEPAAA